MTKPPTLEFFLQSLTHFRETGTIFPCSRFAGRAIAKRIDNRKGTIVELGGGTGPITRQALKEMNGLQRYVCIEKNPRFYEILCQIKDERLEIVHDCAENFPRYIQEKPICIISTLPLAIFTKPQKEEILETIKENLAANGTFMQFQYLLRDYRTIKSFFRDVEINFIPLNFPPGFIYTCRN